MGPSSVPPQTSSLRISGCGQVHLAANTLARCADLVDLEMSNLKKLKLEAGFHTRSDSSIGSEEEYDDYDDDDEGDSLAV